jgi:3-methylcrotonyl-CoA carboxylase beta subunit
MQVLASNIDINSKDFQLNAEFNRGLANELKKKIEKVRQGGGDDAVKKHKARKKLLPRERIEKILDPGSPFLELSTLAANDVYEEDVPGAGIGSAFTNRIAAISKRIPIRKLSKISSWVNCL